MKGTHTVVVERAKVKYTLTFKRNISFIRGNSGTGKTTLISMIRDYNDRGPESGVTLSCDVPCETLSGRRWERELSIIEDSIVFLDEGNEFIYGESSEQVQRLVVVDLPGALPLETLAWSPVE